MVRMSPPGRLAFTALQNTNELKAKINQLLILVLAQILPLEGDVWVQPRPAAHSPHCRSQSSEPALQCAGRRSTGPDWVTTAKYVLIDLTHLFAYFLLVENEQTF